jgi:uncharacterized protein (TIGR02246 family)
MRRFVVVLVLMSGCLAADSGPQEVLRQIIAANNHADLQAVREVYADDAVWLPPSGPTIEGKDAIVKRYEQSFATVRLSYTFEEVENQVAGEWAFSRGFTKGQVVPRDGSPPRQIHDKYLMILHKVGGQWKIARLMWNPAT